jgi:hypothetical protein
MIPQERGIEGISVYSYYNYHFFSKGGNRLCELLGEIQEVLYSPPSKLLKLASGLIGGLIVGSFSPSLLHSHHSVPHALSFTHLHAPTYSFIDPSIIHVLARGKGAELLKISHGIVGCSGRWCDLAMT